jgi:CTP synthase
MRLGLRPTVFEPNTDSWAKIRKLYGGAGKIWERHRHRYEVNPEYVDRLHSSGLSFVGKDERGERMQILELPGELSVLSLLYFLSKFFRL